MAGGVVEFGGAVTQAPSTRGGRQPVAGTIGGRPRRATRRPGPRRTRLAHAAISSSSRRTASTASATLKVAAACGMRATRRAPAISTTNRAPASRVAAPEERKPPEEFKAANELGGHLRPRETQVVEKLDSRARARDQLLQAAEYKREPRGSTQQKRRGINASHGVCTTAGDSASANRRSGEPDPSLATVHKLPALPYINR